jgi:hypothetical protein
MRIVPIVPGAKIIVQDAWKGNRHNELSLAFLGSCGGLNKVLRCKPGEQKNARAEQSNYRMFRIY